MSPETMPDQVEVTQEVSAVQVGIPSACSFCGCEASAKPHRVLQHENGAAICSDCVAAAVLSLASYAAQATGTGSAHEGAVGSTDAPHSPDQHFDSEKG